MEQIVKELEKLNEKADVIIGILQKPENRFIKALEIAGTVISVSSLISVIDIVKNWLVFYEVYMFFQLMVSISLLLIGISLILIAQVLKKKS